MVYYKRRNGQRLIADLLLESFSKTEDKNINKKQQHQKLKGDLALLRSTSQRREDVSFKINC